MGVRTRGVEFDGVVEIEQRAVDLPFLHQSGSAVEEGDRAVRVERNCDVIVGNGTIDIALNRIEIAASDI